MRTNLTRIHALKSHLFERDDAPQLSTIVSHIVDAKRPQINDSGNHLLRFAHHYEGAGLLQRYSTALLR